MPNIELNDVEILVLTSGLEALAEDLKKSLESIIKNKKPMINYTVWTIHIQNLYKTLKRKLGDKDTSPPYSAKKLNSNINFILDQKYSE
jgi:hypothetical protein